MTYATTTELAALTGSYHDTATLQALLDEADRKIKSRLASAEVSAPASDDYLKSAGLAFAKADLLDRLRIDGSNVTEPQYNWGAEELNNAIKQLREEALVSVDAYIHTSQTQRYRFNISKVNS